MRSKLEKHIVFDAEELSLDDIKQKLLLIQSKINSKRGAIVSLLSELIKDPYQYCERSEYKKIFDVLVGKIEKGQIRRRLASDILDVRYKLQSLAGSLHQDREVSDNPSQEISLASLKVFHQVMQSSILSNTRVQMGFRSQPVSVFQILYMKIMILVQEAFPS